MRDRVASGVVVAALVALTPPTFAAEGRTPIHAAGPITTSGKFVLTRDIVGDGSTPAIAVQAVEVDIDLNGFSVFNSLGQDAIYVSIPQARLTVRNGTLASCHSGVYAPVAALVVLEDLKIKDTWGPGIALEDVPSIVIRRVVGTGIGSDGIAVYGSVAHNAEIVDCSLVGAGDDGIVFNTGTPILRGNRVTGSVGVGLFVFGATSGVISGNAIERSGGTVGMELAGSYANVVEGNAVRSSFGNGIHVAADSRYNLIRNNISALNGTGPTTGHGLVVDGWLNQIEQNVLSGNAGAGLLFGTTGCGNTFGRNTARVNAGVGVPACTGSPALFSPDSCNTCTATDVNSSFGDNLIPGPPVF